MRMASKKELASVLGFAQASVIYLDEARYPFESAVRGKPVRARMGGKKSHTLSNSEYKKRRKKNLT